MTAGPEITLVRATELIKLPVVSVATGEALADIKDVLYDPDRGAVLGFTLNKRGGFLSGPLKRALPTSAITAIGHDAVMVADDSALAGDADRAAADAASEGARNVLGNEVLTDGGDRLGVVNDLVVGIGYVQPKAIASGRGEAARTGDVVGYQLVGDESLQGRAGAHLLVPLPFALSISGTHLLVPASVVPFLRDDLAGFGAAVADFRAQLDTEHDGERP